MRWKLAGRQAVGVSSFVNIRLGAVALAVLAVAALPAASQATPTATTYPRTIAFAGAGEGLSVTRLQASIQPAGRWVRMTVRLAAASLTNPLSTVIAVGACTKGPPINPVCPVTRSTKITIDAEPVDITRSFLVPRPPAKADALRVTVRAAGAPSNAPFLGLPCRSRARYEGGRLVAISGFCTTGELLFNGGAWRRSPGTPWGIEVGNVPGVSIRRVVTNVRQWSWTATADTALQATTRWGLEGPNPSWQFTNWLKAAAFTTIFHNRQMRSATPQVAYFKATAASGSLFTVRMPIPGSATQ